MKRQVKIKVISTGMSFVTFKISKQTHFGERFTPDGYSFNGSNGFCLQSDDSGQRYSGVRGALVFANHPTAALGARISVTPSIFKKIKDSINKYNSSFPDMPMIITSTGSIKNEGRAECNLNDDE